MKQYLLGIDIGTSACKAALFTPEGACAAATETPYDIIRPKPGWTEQHPDTWWQAAAASVRQLLAESGIPASAVAGVGVDGQSWAMVPVDAQGTVLTPSPIWTDSRAQAECAEMLHAAGEEALFACSGNPVMPGYTLPKVLWMKKHFPDAYRRTDKVLQSNGYIVYRLTGQMTQDLSQGYGWHCFHNARGTWDHALAGALGIRTDILPEICACTDVVGHVSRAAADETGLAEGTPVVAGGLDAACGTLGVGVIHAGQTQEQGGQAGGMSICLEDYAAHPALIVSQHVVPGRWLLQGGTTGGGGALKWFREQFCPDMTFEQMSEEAAQAPAGSGGVIFLPYLAGERSPIWQPNIQGMFYGLNYGITRRHMIRAVMEGVAFSLRHNLETAALAGAGVGSLRATGGSAKSPVWAQIKADITGQPIDVPQADSATAFGAALLAGLGTGIIPSVQDVSHLITISRQYTPNKDHQALYQQQYETYLSLASQAETLCNASKKGG